MRHTYIYVFFFFMFCNLLAQDNDFDKLQEKYKQYYLITDPDQKIMLDEVVLFPAPKFKTSYDKRYYNWFKRKTYKAYPYAVLAKENLKTINDSIQEISSKRKRKKYIKQKQEYFERQFSENIKKLTKTEGRILIKLVHRLTGKTVNAHLQDKKGKFKAFLYRTSAKVFKIKLDLEYHPESLMEDYMIESILQEAFNKDYLNQEPSVLKSAKLLYPSRVIQIKKK